MLIFMALAAGLPVESQPTMRPPTPRSPPTSWFNDGDFPPGELGSMHYAGVGVRLEIDADGKIIRCLTKSGNKDSAVFEKASCDLIYQRAKFMPAADRDGKPVIGVFKTRIFWTLSVAQGRNEPTPELTFTLSALPAGVHSSDRTDINLLIGADGVAKDCSVDTPPPSKNKRENMRNAALQNLAQAACKAAVGVWKTAIVLDRDGKPAESMQAATVEFVLAKAQPK